MAGFSTPSPNGTRAIDRLKKAFSRQPLRKEITLTNGEVFVLCHKPMTLADDERIRKEVGDEGGNAYALRLLVDRAEDEDGGKMFSVGDLPELKRLIDKKDAEALMLAILQGDGEPLDMKRSES